MPNHQVAIVTGASSGIGRATCFMLAAEGFNLALVARRKELLDQTAAAIQAQHPEAECLVLPTNLADDQAARSVIDRTLSRFGQIDALVNAAGAAPLLPIAQVTANVWRECLDTNLTYVVAMTAKAWPIFSRQRSGIIVNISSMASIDPFPGFAIYAAAKVGLNMFTLCTAREGQEIGVRAVAIAPGCVETPMLRQLFGTDMVPPEKALPPEAIGRVIVECVTGTRSFKPGETIVVPSP